jgi:endo-alpha-1,4-polygalactosaminidase (GH114 family)
MITAVSVFALAIGLGAQLTYQSQSPVSVQDVNTRDTAAIWQPKAGASWQIDIYDDEPNVSVASKVDIWDVDLDDISDDSLTAIKATGAKVICYFSAGTQEQKRKDSADFTPDDLGVKLADWPELWVRTYSENVHKIMRARIDHAKTRGCDGVDPDNTDAYNNGGGGFTPKLNEQNAIDYVNFLADYAHSVGLSIGLKNSADLIKNNALRAKMQWAVNEQCTRCHRECSLWQPFLNDTPPKPVFHIEYPFFQPTCTGDCQNSCDQSCKEVDGAPPTLPNTIPQTMLDTICKDKAAAGFSTVMKGECLNNYLKVCP